MKIICMSDETATLPKDRAVLYSINGAGTLLLTRNENAVEINNNRPIWIMNFCIVSARGRKTRISRFFYYMKYVWEFSK